MAIVHIIDGVIPFCPLWWDHVASSGEQVESQRNRYYLWLEHNPDFLHTSQQLLPTYLLSNCSAAASASPSGTEETVEQKPQLPHVDISLATEILRLFFFLWHDLAHPD